MGVAVNHGRMREKYHPMPNAAEKRHHMRLIELPCCGCGIEPCGIAHHVLGHELLKRWRRDHRIVVPVCPHCHANIHEGEPAWEAANDICLGTIASDELFVSKAMGIL